MAGTPTFGFRLLRMDRTARAAAKLDWRSRRFRSRTGAANRSHHLDRRRQNGQLRAAEKQSSPGSAYAAIEEDVFVNQMPSLTWSAGPISSQPATELVQDPKAAILRARDQFRQRRKNEGRLADRVNAPIELRCSHLLVKPGSSIEPDLAEPDPAPESVDPRYENGPLLRTASPEPT